MPTIGSLLLQQSLAAAQARRAREDALAQAQRQEQARASEMAYGSQLDTEKALRLEKDKRDSQAVQYGQAKGQLGEEAIAPESGEVSQGQSDLGELLGRAVRDKQDRQFEAQEELKRIMAEASATRQAASADAIAERQAKHDAEVAARQEALYRALKPELDKTRHGYDMERDRARIAQEEEKQRRLGTESDARRVGNKKAGQTWEQFDKFGKTLADSIRVKMLSGTDKGQAIMADEALRKLNRLAQEARNQSRSGADAMSPFAEVPSDEDSYQTFVNRPDVQELLQQLAPK